MEAELAILALLVAGYGLIAARLNRFSISASLVFLAMGIILSDDVLGAVSIQPDAEPIKVLAEITLTLLLFADASTVSAAALRRDAPTVARLLIVGLLLTMVLGAGAALLLFPGISLGMALLIGTALAPTDAALGQPVVTNPTVPARIRRVLNVESGLNDGIATPFVFFALALTTSEATGHSGFVVDAVYATAVGAAVGAVIGFVGGFLLHTADERKWTSSLSRKLVPLSLATASYLVAVALGANGFIAAFVGGLAFAAGSRQGDEDAVHFTETQGALLAIGVWAAFGLALAGSMFTSLWNPAAIVYALLSLTLIRMVPVAIALLGERFQPMTVLFVGWFGPRGLASIVFLVIGIVGLEEAGVDLGPFPAAVVWTVVLSVVLHGLSAGPLAERYGRLISRAPAGSPEIEAVPTEPRATRRW